jgi:hypothetical protein
VRIRSVSKTNGDEKCKVKKPQLTRAKRFSKEMLRTFDDWSPRSSLSLAMSMAVVASESPRLQRTDLRGDGPLDDDDWVVF